MNPVCKGARQNKANSPYGGEWARGGKPAGAAGGGKRAKQSQFPRTAGDGREPAGTPVPPPGPSVRNKANFPALTGIGGGPAGAETLPPPGRILRNKANLRRMRVIVSTLWKKGYSGFWLSRGFGKTKPISRVDWAVTDLESATVGRPHVAVCAEEEFP